MRLKPPSPYNNLGKPIGYQEQEEEGRSSKTSLQIDWNWSLPTRSFSLITHSVGKDQMNKKVRITCFLEKILTFAFEWEAAEGVALLKGEASKSRRDTSNESTMTKEYRLIWKNILLLKRPPAGATLTGKADVFDSINDGEGNMREPSKSTGELVDR